MNTKIKLINKYIRIECGDKIVIRVMKGSQTGIFPQLQQKAFDQGNTRQPMVRISHARVL